MDAPTLLPFALLLAAVLGLWIHRFVWIGALLAAIAAGYLTGALQGMSAVWIALFAATCLLYARLRAAVHTPRVRELRVCAGLLVFALAFALFVPLLPGFIRVVLVPARALTPDAVPYAISVGFPKVVTGILILGLINPTLLSRQSPGVTLARSLPILMITVTTVIVFSVAMGFTSFAPKWTPLFLLWATVNLFFTCLAEEAVFRGFVQAELARVGNRRGVAGALALLVGAILFGFAHYAGGVSYMIAGALAGLGYGWAFLRTQRIEAAMAVHFGLNATHYLLFVYPRLAP